MFWVVVLFIVGIVLIVKGGDFFVDAASWIAEKSGIPKFIVGATIVSIGTTLPEMVTSIIGAAEGSNGLAIGNAIGSVTGNVGLIMAISILAMPAVIDRKQYMFKSVLLLIITVVLWMFLSNNSLNLVESILCLVFVVAFIWENIVSAKNSSAFNNLNKGEKVNETSALGDVLEDELTRKNNKKELIKNIIMFILGVLGIYFGSDFLVTNGKKIAYAIGVSEAIIGLTIVAIGTSLPELVTTITAIVKKQSSLSVGNIIGANIIDMAIILPICSFVCGGTLMIESTQTIYLDIPVCLSLLVIALVPTLIRKKFSRIQGALMLTIYIIYIIIICSGVFTFTSFL